MRSEQNDTVEDTKREFGKEIEILENTKYLYGTLQNFKKEYSKVNSIKFEDPGGKEYSFSHSPFEEQQQIIKDPIHGTWKVKCTVRTNTPIFFQLQTVPTKDPYETIRKTFEEDTSVAEYSQWKEFVIIGLAGMHSNQTDVHNLVGRFFKRNKEMTSEEIDKSNRELLRFRENIIEETASTQEKQGKQGLSNILLADANGEDELTKNLFSARKECLYSYLEFSNYRNNFYSLSKVNKVDFQNHLRNNSIKLVSFGGHGGINEIQGHGERGETILTSQDIVSSPRMANGKIFHAFACSVGSANENGLGHTLTNNENGAIAFIGYRDIILGVTSTKLKSPATFLMKARSKIFHRRFKSFRDWSKKTDFFLSNYFTGLSDWDFGEQDQCMFLQYLPDCMIVKALIDGSTIDHAMMEGRSWYDQIANFKGYLPLEIGFTSYNRDQLVIYGDRNAVL